MPCKGEDCIWDVALMKVEGEYIDGELDSSATDEEGLSKFVSAITLATLLTNRSMCDGEPCKVLRSFALRATQLAKDPILFSLYDNVYNEK